MAMDGMEQHCPPAVVERVGEADLAGEDSVGLLDWVAENAELRCQVLALAAVADRAGPETHPLMVADLCFAAATYASALSDAGRARIGATYRRMPYRKSSSFPWFLGLRENRIELRDRMAPLVIEDWSFTHPRRDAETWDYYLYLAVMGTPGAYEKLEAKLKATLDGNDATNLIRSLAELKTPEVRAILEPYRDDQRTSDGTEEPGPTIAETVGILLSTF
ncbi:hypothetical protein ACQ5SO_16660 [Rhodovulum sp. DZ06]|uniref:hypothetical protein n=1 Tax=Rhodovulum sp. DZ06 TaxID=3425126 RepID=UPI003D3385FE